MVDLGAWLNGQRAIAGDPLEPGAAPAPDTGTEDASG
jgi:endogenous inhibitor of DNA gyrase (YacG/DUF329 family)